MTEHAPATLNHWCPWCNEPAVFVEVKELACDAQGNTEWVYLYRCKCKNDLSMHDQGTDFCWCEK